MGCTSGYGKSSANFDKCFCCVAKGTCGIYHVVKDDAFFAFYVTDDVHNFGNVCFRAAFIDDCKRDIEFFSKFTYAVYAAVVGNNAQKRNARLETAMDEYWECIPNGEILPEDRIVLKDLINRFLADLDKQTRIIFLQRYWYICTAKEIARNVGLSENNVNVILHRTRNRFKLYLQKEGISV